MAFFSKIKQFLNARAEILERLDDLERNQKKLENSHSDLDDFIHRLARRRIAKGEDRFVEEETQQDAPGTPIMPTGGVGGFSKEQKVALLNQARQKGIIR